MNSYNTEESGLSDGMKSLVSIYGYSKALCRYLARYQNSYSPVNYSRQIYWNFKYTGILRRKSCFSFSSFSTVTFAIWINFSTYNHLETFEELCHGFSKRPYFWTFVAMTTRDEPLKDRHKRRFSWISRPTLENEKYYFHVFFFIKMILSTLDCLETFEELCLGFSERPYFWIFMTMTTRGKLLKDERRHLTAWMVYALATNSHHLTVRPKSPSSWKSKSKDVL